MRTIQDYMIRVVIGMMLSGITQAFAQSQLVINNDAWMVMQNDVYLVVDNQATNAISTAGTGGHIVSEGENNIVQWNITSGSGSYVIPFSNAAGLKIPLTFTISAAGTGSGKILFSTYGGPTWDNDNYRPSGVSNMSNMGVTNNSAEVIDRFWIIDAQGYTTKPSGDILFTYIDAEHTAPGNTITEADLKAERYDPPTNDWEINPVGGTVNTTSNYVGGVPFNSADLVRSWTLIDQTTHLLPLVLLDFTAACSVSGIHFEWVTASEIHTDHFRLEYSFDGVHFTEVAHIPAAGESQEELHYDVDVMPGSVGYYRLIINNDDGSEALLGVLSPSCTEENNATAFAWSSSKEVIMLQTQLESAGMYLLNLFDLAGQCVAREEVYLDSGLHYHSIQGVWATGVYIIQLTGLAGNTYRYIQKVPITY
ncbi:MAG: hypothetical protein R2794_00655 [Chitinophagales bacterium]